MPSIHTFDYNGKSYQVNEDLTVSVVKPLEPGSYRLGDVRHRMNPGDSFWVEFRYLAGGVSTLANAQAAGCGDAYLNGIYMDTDIHVGKPPQLSQPEPANDMLYCHQLTDSDIGKRFEIVFGADVSDRDEHGRWFKLEEIDRDGEDRYYARGKDGIGTANVNAAFNRNTLLRRLP